MVLKKGYLALESGKVFEGTSFGAENEACGEAVFNTSVFGYQEIITDPSSFGHITCFNHPHVGNYGCNKDSNESPGVCSGGIVVKECSAITANQLSEFSLQELILKNNAPGIEGVDTRALTKHLRDNGSLKAVISFLGDYPSKLVEKAKELKIDDSKYIPEVSCKEKYIYCQGDEGTIGVIDYGCKSSFLKGIASKGFKIIVFPYNVKASEIMESEINGLFLSNGPGRVLKEMSASVKEIIEKCPCLPVFGVCAGFQVIADAYGAKFKKHKIGRHGANHPVKNLETGRVEITAQNNRYTLDAASIEKSKDFVVTHINLFDNSVQGIKHKKLPLFAVQYYPATAMSETSYLFENFFGMVKKNA
ncbi:MAG: glutamine-hydrolyzing carbamoyl-phosphate synthase small subunit [Endomicrobia bacterium]|nr:glutamine-hydrolyzing carbamoyl-phosphate synthase small subunit [Endomicrobiia bacterium]